MEPFPAFRRRNVMYLPQRTAATLALVALTSTACNSEREADPVAQDISVAASNPSPKSDEWACPPETQKGFATDPVVYPVQVSLEEIASRLPGTHSFEIEQSGQHGTVTYRGQDGLIIQRMEYSRERDRGWALERGLSCGS